MTPTKPSNNQEATLDDISNLSPIAGAPDSDKKLTSAIKRLDLSTSFVDTSFNTTAPFSPNSSVLLSGNTTSCSTISSLGFGSPINSMLSSHGSFLSPDSSNNTNNSNSSLLSPSTDSANTTILSPNSSKTPVSTTKKRKEVEISPEATNTPEQLNKLIKSILEGKLSNKPLSDDRENIIKNADMVISKSKKKQKISSPEIKALQNEVRAKAAQKNKTSKRGKNLGPLAENNRAIDAFGSSSKLRDLEYGLGSNRPPEENRAEFFNLDHLVRPQRNGGFHFIVPTDPRWNTLKGSKTGPTGVVSGSWMEAKGTLKHSSFYPKYLSNEEELFDCIHSSVETDFRSSNPNVFLLRNDALNLYIEAFRDPRCGAIYKSAYPIFAVIRSLDLSKTTPIEITKPDSEYPSGYFATPHEISQAIGEFYDQRMLEGKTDSPFTYTNPATNTGLIDIAPHLKAAGVPRGIFVEVALDLSMKAMNGAT